MFGIWDVGSLRHGISEISDVRRVKCVGCEMFAEMCDVDLQNAVLEEGLLDYIFQPFCTKIVTQFLRKDSIPTNKTLYHTLCGFDVRMAFMAK